MADHPPQDHDKIEMQSATFKTSQDLYWFLINIIEAASRNPAQLRKLVYAMVWHSLKPESVLANRQAVELGPSQTINELQQALEFERAVEQIEADVTPAALGNSAQQLALELENQQTVATGVLASEETISAQTTKDAPFAVPAPSDLNAPVGHASDSTAVVVVPERAPDILLPGRPIAESRPPSWLTHRVHVSVEMTNPAQTSQSYWSKTGFVPFLQLVAASMIGVVLYVGISGWVQSWRQRSASDAVQMRTSPSAHAEVTPPQLDAQRQLSPQIRSMASGLVALPFPLPKTYGVYAGSGGQLTELATLPIKIPDPRVQLSAEIKTPSQAVVGSGKIIFVLFRRDLLNSAPQTISVRVVARVTRDLRFVQGKPVATPIQDTWRIGKKSYPFKVAPLDGHPEIIVVQPDPDFVFPAGRYALVLNGVGYDFTVPGAITSPEQCLEQAELLNGTVLSECGKS